MPHSPSVAWSPLLSFVFVGALLLGSSPSFAQDYELVWSDEFDGTSLDLSKWEHQIGTGCPDLCGWGNNELQYYRAENTTVAGGLLTITAKQENFGGRQYTSSRIRTLFQGDWKYGRFEIRAKLPIGRGLWPAFWMLPTDELYGGWAASGEIDIMEYLGQDPDRVLGTLHYGGSWPNNVFSGDDYILPSGTFNEDFHDFALEWDECGIRWYVDDVLYATQRDWYTTNAAHSAPFDQRFHMLVNMAVGGNLPGNPDGTTMFPQELILDYVRVYQKTPTFDDCRVEFDGMEHGNPFGRDWFIFGGTAGSGSIVSDYSDVPPVEGCDVSLRTQWSTNGNPGWVGGFGRTRLRDLTDATHFTFWIDPDANQEYLLEINLQDDDNGDDEVPGSPDGQDDEFQYNFRVGPAASDPDAIAGGGWQRVSIPFTDFFDDNSYHWGGNGVFDPIPVSSGGNGQLTTVVFANIATTSQGFTFKTDRWAFTSQTATISGRVFDDTNSNGVDDGEPGISDVRLELIDTALGMVLGEFTTAPDGSYEFADLMGALYEVRIDETTLPSGVDPTGDPDGTATPGLFETHLECAEVLADQNFGYAAETSSTDLPVFSSHRPELGAASPNPWSERNSLEWHLPNADLVNLKVFDVQGRTVRNLYSGDTAAGLHRTEWDGRDENGERVPAGTYFYRLETSTGSHVRSTRVVR